MSWYPKHQHLYIYIYISDGHETTLSNASFFFFLRKKKRKRNSSKKKDQMMLTSYQFFQRSFPDTNAFINITFRNARDQPKNAFCSPKEI